MKIDGHDCVPIKLYVDTEMWFPYNFCMPQNIFFLNQLKI